MGKKFVGFGELLVRLATPGVLRFPQADSFNINYTGAEGNMAVALSYMGCETAIVTKLPDNEIGHCAARKMAQYGVDISHIAFGGERMGIYYLERGASQRPSKIIYDRKYSAISTAEIDEFDFEKILSDACWFHFTGITAALSGNTAEMCRIAAETAHRLGVPVSCDLNYRKNLWTPEQAADVMRPLMQHVDVLIANEEDCEKTLGISAGADVTSGSLDADAYCNLAQKLFSAFGFGAVAFTLRESISASVNNWSGLLCRPDANYHSKKYTMQIVDRVGGGDSFASGLIYALLHGMTDQQSIEYAVAASCLKHSIENDFNLSTVDEVLALMGGDGSGRVVR